jgi:hypothetical protein
MQETIIRGIAQGWWSIMVICKLIFHRRRWDKSMSLSSIRSLPLERAVLITLFRAVNIPQSPYGHPSQGR